MAAYNPIVDVDRVTGELISGWPRCKQSILVILTTRLRTRTMRRWWGSNFLDMQDQPGNEQTFYEGLGEALIAITRYEPEFIVNRLMITGQTTAGEVEITVEGEYVPDRTEKKITYTI
jgi:phage baseplate assembly protein W